MKLSVYCTGANLRDLIPHVELILGDVVFESTILEYKGSFINYDESEFWVRSIGHFMRHRTFLQREWNENETYSWICHDSAVAKIWSIESKSNIYLTEYSDGHVDMGKSTSATLEIEDDEMAVVLLLQLPEHLKGALSRV